MEKRKVILVVVLVLYLHSWPQADGRIRAIGCSFYKKLCKPGEDCDKEDSYPFGKCKRYQLKHQKDSTNKKYWRDEVGEIEDRGRTLAKAFSTEKEQRREVKDGSEGRYYQNSKYDMTYFENDNSFNQIPHEERKAVGYEKLSSPNSVRENLGEGYRRQQDVEESGHYGGRDSLHQLKHEQTLNLERYEDDSGPLRGSTVDFPKEHSMHHQLEESGNSKFNIVEVTNEKRTTKSDNEYQNPENDNSLDLDVEIKPLSLSDSKYFEEKKAKHSSIPKTPSLDNKNLEKLEHIQADILDKTPAKKTEVNVLVGGRLNRAETGTVREKNPDQTYDKIKDFFKSQQVSSLVDAPVAEKKQSVKLYSSVPENKDVNVRRSSIPTSSVYPVRIRLDVKQRISLDQARNLLNTLQDLLWGPNAREAAFTSLKTEDKVIFFHMLNNTTTSDEDPSSVVDRINYDKSLQNALMKASGITVVSASLQDEEQEQVKEDSDFMVTTLIVAGCVTGILLASVCIFIILKRSQDNSKWVPKQAGKEAASDYQSLWRQLRQATWEAPIHTPSVAHADNGDQKGYFGNKGMPPRYSWSEEPVDTKMDVSTGHVVLAYMEDHLKNENRLSKEWEDLSVYEAEPDLTDVGRDPTNSKKNRYSDVLPYDHNRVKLRETSNASGCDYINASYIIDDDPRNPAYIATQGPLGNTVADFWQMVWEQGVVVIVMLTKLADLGLPQCHRYWPEKGREVYHIYQVHLISEHIWCSDYLVRSFYLKNVQTGETRTVTQFHFLTWPHLGIPVSSKPLLDFRRKVLKCYRSHSSPIVVHCSGGIDRTGTYILIDMVLSKMSRGTKEIDIAATLEHLRDQRPDMVKTKAQFEFALISVAEEVNAILQVLTKH